MGHNIYHSDRSADPCINSMHWASPIYTQTHKRNISTKCKAICTDLLPSLLVYNFWTFWFPAPPFLNCYTLRQSTNLSAKKTSNHHFQPSGSYVSFFRGMLNSTVKVNKPFYCNHPGKFSGNRFCVCVYCV